MKPFKKSKQDQSPTTIKSLKAGLIGVYKTEERAREQKRAAEKEQSVITAAQNMKSFFRLSEDEAEEIEVYEVDGFICAKYSDVTFFPKTPTFLYPVISCPYCQVETVSAAGGASHVELGSILSMIETGTVYPCNDHALSCKEMPPDKKRAAFIDTKKTPAEELVEALKNVLGR